MDWDDVRVFLAIERAGSFSAAAKALEIDATTAGRRLARLEDAVGAPLFDRSASGAKLTPIGEEVLPEAKRLEDAALAITSVGATELTSVTGTVRLATAETLFTAFLRPHLDGFRQAHPDLCLELVTSTTTANLLKREADIALRPSAKRPNQKTIVVKKLAKIGYSLYASDAYLRRHGRPTPGTEGHELIGVDPRHGPDRASEWWEQNLGRCRITFTANSMLSRAEACAAGWGLAALPCFLAMRYPGLVRLESDLPVPYLWLLVHPELRRSARIRAALDFLSDTARSHRALLEGTSAD